jgi:hypothetical protein
MYIEVVDHHILSGNVVLFDVFSCRHPALVWIKPRIEISIQDKGYA